VPAAAAAMNPAHPDFLKIEFRDPQAFEFGLRVFR
jgi:hypothetical protein